MQIHSGSLRSALTQNAINISNNIAPIQAKPKVIQLNEAELLSNAHDDAGDQKQAYSVPLTDAKTLLNLDQLTQSLDRKLDYEQYMPASQGAISAYLTNQYGQQRDAISAMVGIDIYA
ncbi:hypothetical protein [Shewanella sp. Isolate11]|uniref:hypothetical protein n=1 Tax=Shewanella sp. Isolate11 TaxID=2908530 RepID=UPI001EFD7493|nr:hypothetical protein [Shewanella sp. Isolate11]MCG9696837.1 hypothetical protein [Shewanella sp. Isolate11]